MTTGTEGPDNLTNETSGEHIDALGGDDVITVVFFDYPSHVTVDGGAGFDILYFSTGVLRPTGEVDVIFGRQTSSINGTLGWTNIERFVLTFTQYSGSTPVLLGDAEDWITSNRSANVPILLETGGGNDRIIFTDLQVGAEIDLGTGDDSVDFSASAPTRSAIFLVEGGEGNDSLIGSTYRDEFYGDGGNDLLDGRGTTAGQQADLLVGGAGDDIYVVRAGDSIVENAGEGIDEVRTALRSFTLPEHFENLTVTAGGSNLRANSADNVVTGSDNAELFYLDDGGADTVHGNGGNDFFYFGGAFVQSGASDDRAFGGAGRDFILLQGSYAPLSLRHPHQINGIESLNVLSGGDDRYGGATGAPLNYDIIIHDDLLVAGQALEISATGLVFGERLVFDGTGETSARFTVYGGAGEDRLATGGGGDFIDGGAGRDRMAGGGGDDVYYVDNGLDIVLEDAGGGYDHVYTSVSLGLAAGQEIEFLGTRDKSSTVGLTLRGNEFANTIGANNGNNSLYGEDGNDKLYGFDGNDNLFGGVGRDHMLGGLGNDVYWVDDAFDIAQESAGEGFDSVFTSISYKLRLGSEIEQLAPTDKNGTTALTLIGNDFQNAVSGNAGNNNLYGEGGDDQLHGLAGNDHLFGGAGADRMDGGDGNDSYYVDNSADIVVETSGRGHDGVYSSVDYTLAAGVFVELLGTADPGGTAPLALTGNDEAQTIGGNAGNNLLIGGGGGDRLMGAAGNDTIDGGLGADIYEGGAGADIFRFTNLSTPTEMDWVRDFVSGADKIDLSALDANTVVGGDQAFAFIGAAAFSGTPGELRYDSGAGLLFGDTNGDGAADLLIQLDGSGPVVSDFVL